MGNRPRIQRRRTVVEKAKTELRTFLRSWRERFELTPAEELNLLATDIAETAHYAIKSERQAKRAADVEAPIKQPFTSAPLDGMCWGSMDEVAQAAYKHNAFRCCMRAGEYNGFGSDGPLKFKCAQENGCPCHD